VRREMAGHYPHLAEIAMPAAHDGASMVGPDCDQQFEFALDLLLDGFERLRRQRWMSGDQRRQMHDPSQLERQAGEQA
jgi:hypothetical protein